jgi:hypothetical protein
MWLAPSEGHKMKIMNKLITLLVLLVVTALIGGTTWADDTPSGKPFQFLQEQVTGLLVRMGLAEDLMADHETQLGDMSVEMSRVGKLVSPGLYEVHKRILWDSSWMADPAIYYETPGPLYYGAFRYLFLKPLDSYGIPPTAAGATRKVRLYVHYGHQWMCGGTPTVTIGDVEFELPEINGYFADMGANWSNFREEIEYQHLGHTGITMHLKDFVWEGAHCGATPSAGIGKPKGVVYRIEAHFYDEFLPQP